MHDHATTPEDMALSGLRKRYPGAEIWHVAQWDGHSEWVLRLHADRPEHLEGRP
jgi:hypothetical protein